MGAIKYRSLVDFAAILAGDRGGINLGLDGALFIREETSRGVFNPPRIGTQGSSASDTNASTDISAGPADNLTIAVDGGTALSVTLTLAGLTSGAAIEAELESKINAALVAAGQNGRVWVDFQSGGPDQYTVYSQRTGVASTVVITAGTGGGGDVTVALKLGTANSGTEAAGTDDQDFFLYTTGGPTFNQPAESNSHRSGRFHVGVVKRKKVVEFDFDAMLNMSGNAGDSLDTAIRLLYKNVFGKETVVASTSIKYEQGLPNSFFSMVRSSTIFSEYFTGCYTKDWTMNIPGDDAVNQKFTGRGADATEAGLAQIDGAVVSSASVVVNAGHAKRFTAGARVMVVDTDGVTILAGADGSLLVSGEPDLGTNTVTLDAPVDASDDAYLVYWHPGAIQQTGTDAIFTDLEGSIKLDSSLAAICATNITLGLVNDHIDLDNCFGSDTNQGFAAGNRATFTLSVTADLSNENYGEIVQLRKFGGLSPEIIVGDTGGRHLKITAPNWIPSVPTKDLPENGTVPVTIEGTLYQSAPGEADPVLVEFL